MISVPASTAKVARINDQKELKHLKDIIDVKKNLEKGDLHLNQSLQKVLIFVGKTKIGKTTICHLLTESILEVLLIQGEAKLVSSSNKNQTAKIGLSFNSQTAVPNVFKTSINNEKINLVDTPGYQDTKGVFGIFVNGYFHNRVFSISRSMKFMICFDFNTIRNTAEGLIETIQQFTYYFKNYNKIKQEIWKSCLFIFNMTRGKNDDVQDVKKKLETIAQTHFLNKMDQNTANNFRQFLRYIIRNDRIYCIRKYEEKQKPQSHGWLQQINNMVPSWWSRNVDDKGQIDMSEIKISIGSKLVELIQNQKTKQQYIEMIKYFNFKVFNQFPARDDKIIKNSLQQVLHNIKQDTLEGMQNHQKYLQTINNIVREKYKILFGQDKNIKKQNENKIQVEEIKQKRMKRIKKIFKTDNLSTTSSINKKPFFLKKIEFIEQVEKICLQQKYILDDNCRTLQTIQKLQQAVISIFKKMLTISYKKNNQEVIMQYGYLIYLMLEENKLFISLMSQNKQKLDNQTVIPCQIIRIMWDFFGAIQQNIIGKSIKSQFLKKISIQTEFPFELSVLKFISQVEVNQNDNLVEESDLKLKKIKIYLNFSEQFIKNKTKKSQIQKQLQKLLIQKMIDSRQFLEHFFENSSEDSQKNNYTYFIRKFTWNLGKILELKFRYNYAIQVFKTIDAVESVSRNYELLIEKQPNNLLELQNYCQYLTDHMRFEHAIKLLQNKRQNIFDHQRFIRVNKIMIEIIKKKEIQMNADQKYISRIFNQNFFLPFDYYDENLQHKIMNDYI